MNPFIRRALKSRQKIRDWKGQGYTRVERKYDGHRTMLVRDLDGEFHALGRKADVDLWSALSGASPSPEGAIGATPLATPEGHPASVGALSGPETLRPLERSAEELWPSGPVVMPPEGQKSTSVLTGASQDNRGAGAGVPQRPGQGCQGGAKSVPKSGLKLDGIMIPRGTAIDGEIFVPDGGSQDVKTAINAKEGWRFIAWDVPFLFGKENEFEPGSSGFDDRDSMLHDWGLQTPEVINIPWERDQFDLTKEVLNTIASSKNFEGFVLKASVSHGWWRQKRIRTVDGVVTRVLEGDGRLRGSLGALVISVYDGSEEVEISNVGTGYSDELRSVIWEHRSETLGSVVEVAYDCIQVGRLRFPRFLRFRDDKPANECLIGQVEI